MTERVHWRSRLGFIFAVAGSAVGLANIWRFPYIVGSSGGAAFVMVYLFCLFLVGFPVFIAEILIGRETQSSPSGAFRKLGRNSSWSWGGKLTIFTGFIVSSFYSAVAGWILGYFVEALRGNLSCFEGCSHATARYAELMGNPYWGIGFHLIFILICLSVLSLGVRKGIERGTTIMMPTLFVILLLLVVKGLSLSGAEKGLRFLFSPDWSQLTPKVILMALGQAFFTLSLGQGTMITYGSYLNKDENLIKSCFPVIIVDTLVSLMSAVAVFTIVFSADLEPGSGPGLIFNTLPIIFSQMTGGYFVAILFFLLVTLAALTSEISAMEPTIAYLIDEWKWKRKHAVWACGAAAFAVGAPCALSASVMSGTTFFGMTFLELLDTLCSHVLIPLGALLAVILVGWRWGVSNALTHLKLGAAGFFDRNAWIETYFRFCLKYSCPILIIVVFLNAMGILG